MSSEAVRVKHATPRYRPEANARDVPPGHTRTEVGVIPDGWSTRSLGEIGNCLNGLTYAPSNVRPDGLLVLRASNIGDGGLQFGEDVFVDVDVPERLLVRPDDLLICVRNGSRRLIGKCTLLDSRAEGMTFGAFMSVFRSDDNRFIAYCFQSHIVKRQIFQHLGATINQITKKSLNSFEVPFPPRPERHAVAEALSDVGALMDALEWLIAKKRDLKQAAMQQLLTGQTRLPGFDGKWEVKRLGDVAEIVMGQSPSSAYYNMRGDGLPLIQGNADVSNRNTVPRVFTTEITSRARAGDILLSVRAPVGEVSRTTFEACLGRGVCAIRFSNDFLYHYLVFLEPTWAKHSKGSTFDSVNSNDIKAVEIDFPMDVDEQAAIASMLSDMDAELAALETRRNKTGDLKQAMMQELLTGKTRLVQGEVAHV